MGNYLWIIIVVGAAILLAVGIKVVVFIIAYNNSKKEKESEKEVSDKIESSTNELSSLFGNSDNVESINSSSSRVTITVKDTSKLDTKKIEEQFKDVLFTGNKVIFVVGEKAEDFSNQLKNKIFK